MVKIERAVVSVSDKEGIVDFCKGLSEMGVEIISTGGTARLLSSHRLKVVSISDHTGSPEMMDGRVKTLHPAIFAGLLARRDSEEHMRQLDAAGLKRIDMVVVNLYPFKQTVLKDGADLEEVIENIDIGGPSMIRAAAKNSDSVAVVTDPRRYAELLAEMRANGGELTASTLRSLMLEAFRSTAYYDSLIAAHLGAEFGDTSFPDTYCMGMEKRQDLRYGENPHQTAAFYVDPFARGVCVSRSEQLHGKELSYNNILDLESALELVREFDRPTAIVIKHTNPCGVASADTLSEAFVRSYAVDPLAAYGCVIGLNRNVDLATATEISGHFVDCVIAPDFEPDALELLKKKKNIRLLRTNGPITHDESPEWRMKRIKGGLLVQTNRSLEVTPDMLKVVTKRAPTEEEVRGLLFANKVCKHVWSNSIILVKEETVVGIGAGQMSRVDSSMIAAHKAGQKAEGSVMASDAFFPFRDGIDTAAKAGVTAIIQPGGSIRDQECIDAANEHGMAMVFTGVRLFRH
ncbi:MAG: bifunctional phosphoribosylaminoimidazolecarboxamide formyltransferase/IMP cyclohydrolase [Methanomassiliicoccales archaeon PtaB.Bin134]|nr:MAG: bifunctional phosphoribosylaminoimidazolecarboxamide formyltransferase/IMP cyclohydrolase [Methanomassiliicoccales archaeon PtaB.Bin134]